MTKKNKGQRSGEPARVENQIAKNETLPLQKPGGAVYSLCNASVSVNVYDLREKREVIES